MQKIKNLKNKLQEIKVAWNLMDRKWRQEFNLGPVYNTGVARKENCRKLNSRK